MNETPKLPHCFTIFPKELTPYGSREEKLPKIVFKLNHPRYISWTQNLERNEDPFECFEAVCLDETAI